MIKALIKKTLPKPILNQFNQLKYRGNQVYCPCCEKNFREFMPYRTRNNAMCPNCQSLERHRLLWLYFNNKTNLLTDNLKVLHVAPEAWLSAKLQSQSNLDYLSVDLVSPLAMEKIDITNIPYADQTFDVILCNHVLEHIHNDSKAITELYRVLKMQGWATIQSPIDPDLETTYEDFNIVTAEGRTKAFGQEDHVRIYGKDYQSKLQQGGFKVKIDSYAQELGNSKQHKYGIVGDEDIYFCCKQIKN